MILHKFFKKSIALLAGMALLAGCAGETNFAEAVKASGVLTVMVAEGDSDYQMGLELELMQETADSLGVELVVETCEKSALLDTFAASDAYLALGRIPDSDSIQYNYKASISYANGRVYAVTPRGVFFPSTVSLQNSVVGKSAQLSDLASIVLSGVEGIDIKIYSSLSAVESALQSGAVSAYICYEDEALGLMESDELQAQTLYGADTEQYVVIAKKGAADLIGYVNTVITRRAQEEAGLTAEG